jgi:hypothetical protein
VAGDDHHVEQEHGDGHADGDGPFKGADVHKASDDVAAC